MTRIDTDVPEVVVEIDGKEYPVAARSVETIERIIEADRACAGKPGYKLWLAELEVLLGKAACAELFVSGRRENVDRIQMIYTGVARAFQHLDEELAGSAREREIQAVSTALAPINELMRNVKAFEKKDAAGEVKLIPRR